MNDAKVKELVIYKTKPGVDLAVFKRAAKAAELFLGRQPGYLGRELLHVEESGQWIDLVHWKDKASAKDAATAAMSAPECGEFFSMIAHETAQMLHAERVELP